MPGLSGEVCLGLQGSLRGGTSPHSSARPPLCTSCMKCIISENLTILLEILVAILQMRKPQFREAEGLEEAEPGFESSIVWFIASA